MTTWRESLTELDGAPPLAFMVTEDQMLDLSTAPHALFAGTTGSGKSVGLNVAISTMLARNTPDELEMFMVDPKRVELSPYRAAPHVLAVVTDMVQAHRELVKMTEEMDRRYELLEQDEMVVDIAGYNELHPEDPMPRLVIVVDEIADLVDQIGKKVLEPLVRIAQLGRAAGVHLLVATQRPAADTIPKKFLANLPVRLAFRTQSSTESRLIIGRAGAEMLPGKGAVIAHGIPGCTEDAEGRGLFISRAEVVENRNELNEKYVFAYEDDAEVVELTKEVLDREGLEGATAEPEDGRAVEAAGPVEPHVAEDDEFALDDDWKELFTRLIAPALAKIPDIEDF